MNYDQWLNKGNPVDEELTRDQREDLLHSLHTDLENLYHEYQVLGLEPEEIERLIRDFV